MPLHVFISYRWESEAHQRAVVEFAQTLRRWGYSSWMDLFATHQEDLWESWMRRQVKHADFVLVVGSPSYKRAAEGTRDPEAEGGVGVAWEWRFIQQDLLRGIGKNPRIIPILLGDSSPDAAIPDALSGYSRFTFDREMDRLHRRLQGGPEVAPEPVGAPSPGSPPPRSPPGPPSPPPGTTPVPRAPIQSEGATPRGIPLRNLEEFRMLLDRTQARRTLRALLVDRTRSRRAIIYGEADQGLDVLRTWLRTWNTVPVACVEYVRDGEYATTVDLWDFRTRGGLRAPHTSTLDEAIAAQRPSEPLSLIYDISGAAPRDLTALEEMLRDRLCPAIARHPRPVHIILFHAEEKPRWILGHHPEERVRQERRREIQAVLDAESIHIEPPSFEEIRVSLEKLDANVDVERLRGTYERAKRRGFKPLAALLHDALSAPTS